MVSKPLAKVLPSRPISIITLNDASSENAIDYVTSKLAEVGKSDLVTTYNSASIDMLGGRLTDLEILVQKLRSGSTVEEGVWDIVQRSAVEIKKNVFGDDSEEAKAKEWTQAQAWYLTKLLAKKEEVCSCCCLPMRSILSPSP